MKPTGAALHCAARPAHAAVCLLVAAWFGSACAEPNLHLAVVLPDGFETEGLTLDVSIFTPSQDVSASCEAIAYRDIIPAALRSARVSHSRLLPVDQSTMAAAVPRAGRKLVLAMGTYDEAGDEIREDEAALVACREIDAVDEDRVFELLAEPAVEIKIPYLQRLLLSAELDGTGPGALDAVGIDEHGAAPMLDPPGVPLALVDYQGRAVAGNVRITVLESDGTRGESQLLGPAHEMTGTAQISRPGLFSVELRARYQRRLLSPLRGVAYQTVVDSAQPGPFADALEDVDWIVPGPFFNAGATPQHNHFLLSALVPEARPPQHRLELINTLTTGDLTRTPVPVGPAPIYPPRFLGAVQRRDSDDIHAVLGLSAAVVAQGPNRQVVPGRLIVATGTELTIDLELPPGPVVVSGPEPLPELLEAAAPAAPVGPCSNPQLDALEAPFLAPLYNVPISSPRSLRQLWVVSPTTYSSSGTLHTPAPSGLIGGYCVVDQQGHVHRLLALHNNLGVEVPVFTDLGSGAQHIDDIVDREGSFTLPGMFMPHRPRAVRWGANAEPLLLAAQLHNDTLELNLFALDTGCPPGPQPDGGSSDGGPICRAFDYRETALSLSALPRVIDIVIQPGSWTRANVSELAVLLVRVVSQPGQVFTWGELYIVSTGHPPLTVAMDMRCDMITSGQCSIARTDLEGDGIDELLITSMEQQAPPAVPPYRPRARVIRMAPSP